VKRAGSGLVSEHVAKEATDERADNAKQNRSDDAHRVGTRHESPPDEAADEPNNNQEEHEADHFETSGEVGWFISAPKWPALNLQRLRHGTRPIANGLRDSSRQFVSALDERPAALATR
jgi:hypothetical protein